MMNHLNICVLLTATIDPKDMVLTERNNPKTRENDYINALEKWLNVDSIKSLVFCENSEYNLDKIKDVTKNHPDKNTEILQFNGQNFSKELGKGYGELLIIKHAMTHSQIIKNCDYIIKITGRYFIENIEQLICTLQNKKDIYVVADLRRNLTFADSRIILFQSDFITSYLTKFQDSINDTNGIYFEHVLSRAILCAISDQKKWLPFNRNPIITGFSGTTNTVIRQSFFRIFCRNILCILKNFLMKR